MCNKEYKTYPSKGNRLITCSRKCHGELKRKKMIGNKHALGLKHTEEWKEAASKRMMENTQGFVKGNSGEKCVNWRGGLTDLNKRLRNSIKYREWRKSVFEKNDYTCQDCGERGGYLEADHIKQFAVIIYENSITSFDEGIKCNELWDVNNGRTFCGECHRLTDTYAMSFPKNYTITIS